MHFFRPHGWFLLEFICMLSFREFQGPKHTTGCTIPFLLNKRAFVTISAPSSPLLPIWSVRLDSMVHHPSDIAFLVLTPYLPAFPSGAYMPRGVVLGRAACQHLTLEHWDHLASNHPHVPPNSFLKTKMVPGLPQTPQSSRA